MTYCLDIPRDLVSTATDGMFGNGIGEIPVRTNCLHRKGEKGVGSVTNSDRWRQARLAIRSHLLRFGIDVRRANGDSRLLARILANQGITTVFDIGANIGDYAADLRNGGFRGNIVSFEPLATPHRRLRRRAIGDPRWRVPDPVALSDVEGSVDMHVAQNVVSSSILDALPINEQADSQTRYVSQERVRCVRLDTVAPQFLQTGDRLFIKLDVQGYEGAVLDGGSTTLDRATGVQIELSVVPLYQGAPTYQPMLQRLEKRGFQLWHLLPGFRDEDTGRMLQFDAILVRGK